MKVDEKKRPTARHAARSSPSDSAWTTLRSDGLQILCVQAFLKLPWVVHGFSTRLGGMSSPDAQGDGALNLGFADWDTRQNVQANRAKLLSALDAEHMKLVTLRQFHTDVIHVLDAFPEHSPRGDAVVTGAPGLLLAVQTADCIPILLVDPEHRLVAAVHAGWRGTLRRIAAKTLGRMRAAFETQPSNVLAALGPGIGGCCYEVGSDVAQAYAGQFAQAREWFEGPFDQLATGEEPNPARWLTMAPPSHEPPPPRVRLDLIAANRWQLLDAGLKAANIVSSPLCTSCRTDLLFSYRRERGRTGRMLSVIGLRPA